MIVKVKGISGIWLRMAAGLARCYGVERAGNSQFAGVPKIGRDEVTRGVSDDIKRFIDDQMDAKTRNDLAIKHSVDNKEHNIVQVEGIPKDWEEADIIGYFDPRFKSILSAKHMLNKFGKPTGKVIIEMKDRQAAATFIDRYNMDFIETKDLTSALRARSFDLQSQSKAFKVDKLDRTVMIYDLAFEATTKEVADMAKDFGEIKSFYMPMRSASKNKGYCIIEFDNSQIVQDFIYKCSGMSLFGRELKFKTGHYSFAQGKKTTQEAVTKTKSTDILQRSERDEIKIRNTLNDLMDAEIREWKKTDTDK